MAITYNTSIVRNGLVLHLDAANPKSYPGTGTVWKDLSGNGNHASMVGSSTYLTHNSSGYFNHAPGDVYFGATSDTTTATAGAYWNIPSSISLKPDNGWSVCGMLNIQGTQSTNGGGWFVLDDVDLRVHLEPIGNTFRASGADGWSQIDASVSAYHNKFAYYSFVFTQASGTYGTTPGAITFFVNGVQVASDASFTPTLTTDYQISLGRRRGHLAHFMKAYAGSYQYYTRPITQSEIKQNFEATRGRYSI
jgi:hypothetical protein